MSSSPQPSEPLISHEGTEAGALDPYHRHILVALSQTVPLRYGPITDEEKISPDLPAPLPNQLSAFADPSEVAEATWLIEEIEAVASIPEAFALREPLHQESFFSQLVLTILANAQLSEELKTDPVDVQEAERFAQEALGLEREEFLDSCLTKLAERLPAVANARLVVDRENDDEPMARAMVRLLEIGRARLETDEQPWRVLITR